MLLIKTIKFIINHPLNKSQKLRSILRFIKWQIGSRLVPGSVLFNWINGAKVIASPGETGITGDIYCGLYEFPEMSYLLHVLSKDDLYIDVGTNIGPFLILSCASIGARGYAFEPVPSTYQKLLNNIKINSIESKVECINAAVGSENGEVIMTSNQNTQNHVILDQVDNDSTVKTKIVTLDHMLADENPSLIKIDVEGFETKVLEGAKATLNKKSLHSVILELNARGSNRFGYNDSSIYRTMLDYGFIAYTYDPFKRELQEITDVNLETKNTLFVRDKDKLQEKLNKAPGIKIFGHEI